MFQSEDTITRALQSIYQQDFDDYEVVIVNDGSTDNSLQVAESVIPPEPKAPGQPAVTVRSVNHAQNMGLGPARNTAATEARGKYVVFVDSDDELLPGALAAIGRVAAHSSADLLLLGTLENKRSRDQPLHSPEMLTQIATSDAGWRLADHPELLFWPPSTWSKAFRRDFIIDEDIVFPPGYHQDVPSSAEALLRANSVAGVDHLCYRYIRGEPGSSATLSKGEKTLVRIAQIQRIRERNMIPALPETIKQHLVAMVALHLIWGNRAAYRTMPDHLHEDFFHDSSAELHTWFDYARPDNTVRSEPLMPTKEREFFTVALLSDDYRLWKHAISTHRKKLRWQRRFNLTRYNLFKK
jgi:glycosyltransferase involved in cell wall biosynthesis